PPLGAFPACRMLSAAGSFTLPPTTLFRSSVSFVYQVNDGTADSNLATVSLTITAVNDAPLATAESYTTAEDTALTVDAASGLLTHPTDIHVDPSPAVLSNAAIYCTISLTS